jgi:dTDP-glucose 4,6-dehydratase
VASLLVTGGAGFIGANFVRYWCKRHTNDLVIVLDALTYAGNAENLDGLDKMKLVVEDIANTNAVEQLIDEHQIDTIVHFAAETHVDRSIKGPDAFVQTNIIGTHSLLKAARKKWLEAGSGRPHRFHNVSTDEVYGSLGPDDPAFAESTPYAPNSPYSASKASADHLVRAYYHTYGLETTTSNCSNNYGPYQFPEKLVPLFLINALEGRSLPIYGDGLNVRDWLHVDDHCRGIELILERGRAGETYNIGGGQELPNIEVIDEICRCIDDAFARDRSLQKCFPSAPAASGNPTSTLKSFVEDRKGHDRRYAIDESKIKTELDYIAIWKFRDGIRQTVQWYLSNETWWRRSINKRS